MNYQEVGMEQSVPNSVLGGYLEQLARVANQRRW